MKKYLLSISILFSFNFCGNTAPSNSIRNILLFSGTPVTTIKGYDTMYTFNENVSLIPVSNNDIYAIADDGKSYGRTVKVYYSSDGGNTFQRKDFIGSESSNGTSFINYYSLGSGAYNKNFFCIGTLSSTVSYNGPYENKTICSKNIESTNTQSPSLEISSINSPVKFAPATLSNGVVFISSTSGQYYRSTDFGATYSTLNIGINLHRIVCRDINFCLGFNATTGLVYKSIDSALNWNQIGSYGCGGFNARDNNSDLIVFIITDNYIIIPQYANDASYFDSGSSQVGNMQPCVSKNAGISWQKGTSQSSGVYSSKVFAAENQLYITVSPGNRTSIRQEASLITATIGGSEFSTITNPSTSRSFYTPFNEENAILYKMEGRILYKYKGTGTGTGTSATVTTFAGSGTSGGVDATGTAASFNNPQGITLDSAGNIYVADTNNNKIRKITSTGVVTSFAGSGISGSTDATGTAASFNSPTSAATDSSGNVYVISFNKVRKITPSSVVTTLAGSGINGSTDATGTAASFNSPYGVTVDSSGNVYVADTSNHKIRNITSTGVVTTLAGSGTSGSADGIGTAATFNFPRGVTVDSSGNIYVADFANHKIRKITSAGVVTTLAGSGTSGNTDGVGTAASFNSPYGVTVDSSGNVYVADSNNHKIRKITSSGVVTTLAGSGTSGNTDGVGTAASFNFPTGITISSGNIYITDSSNHKIRKIAQ